MKEYLQLRFYISLSTIMLLCACSSKPKGVETATEAQLITTLSQLESQLRESTGTTLDTAKINTFVQNAKTLADRFPQDSLAPLYLFKAAELRHASGQWAEAIELWGTVDTKFNNYQRSPEALFMQGFVSENDLQDRKQAIRYYEVFLAKHPQHPMADDARVLIENLKKGISDQELIEQFEQQQQ
jgi:outer membrane protein assembly factor BamD (BamD/ComL family)